jgi:hypothetical protein
MMGDTGALVYEQLGPIEHVEAEHAFENGPPRVIARALLRLALHDADWAYVEAACLRFARHPDEWVRRNACTSLGHIARLHQRLTIDRVIPILLALLDDPDVWEYAEAALEDIELFMKVDWRRLRH